MNRALYFGFLLLFLVFLQVFVLNNISFLGFINPYLYISFVFLYPLKEKKIPFLFLSFLLGLSIDFFLDSGGIHAFATLTIAYSRLFFIGLFFKKYPIDYPFFKLNLEPFGKVFNYVVTLTFIHHFILFSFANFSFQNISGIFINTLFSGIFTLLLYFSGTYIFSKQQ
ncbi:MAG: hypothetical protein ACWIPI_07085 [Polaribacter sp.]